MAALPTVRRAAAAKVTAPKARAATAEDEEADGEPELPPEEAAEEAEKGQPPPTPGEEADVAAELNEVGDKDEGPRPSAKPAGEPLIPEGTPRGRASIRSSLHKTPGGSWVRVGPKPTSPRGKPAQAKPQRYYNRGTHRMETTRQMRQQAAHRVTKR